MMLATFAAWAPSAEEAARARIRRLAPLDQEFLAAAPYAGQYRLSQVVSFHRDGERLIAQFHPPQELMRQFADPAPLLLMMEGSDQLWSLHRRKSGTLDEGLSMFTLTCYAADEAGPFSRYSVSADGRAAIVAGNQTAGHPALQGYVSMSAGLRGAVIAYRLEETKYQARRLEVADLSLIPTRAPQLLERSITPILRRLGAGRPAADVYRVFDQIPADPEAARRIQPLIGLLDSDDAAQRDQAQKKIVESGRAGVLACLRLDSSVLSPEQKSRLDSIYRSEGWMGAGDIEQARRDPAWLDSCREDEDPRVREAAEHTLAALRSGRILQPGR